MELNENVRGRLRQILELIYEKEIAASVRNHDRIPYTADENGHFDDWTERDVCWWTNGFWAGLLWQLYAYRQNDFLRLAAEGIERKLDRNLMTAHGMDHDSGFRWLMTSGADYRITKSEKSRNRLLLAASDLAGRFNPAGNFIRAWNDDGGKNAGWAIIDCMMNLPLLYFASEELHDPRFRHIAVRHAQTAMKYFVREDGSCCHIVVFDPETGEFIESLGGQGIGVGSAWTRGQSWGLYGFTLSYMHTSRAEFLAAAEKIANYYIAHIPSSGLIPVDFWQDASCDFEDDTSAAIASCGLIELYKITGKEEYLDAALKMIFALAESRCEFSPDRDELLTHCSAAYHERRHNFPIIYGDYYFTEAVMKLLGCETFLW